MKQRCLYLGNRPFREGAEGRDLKARLSFSALLKRSSPPTKARAAKLWILTTPKATYLPTKGVSARSEEARLLEALRGLPSPSETPEGLQAPSRRRRSPSVPPQFTAAPVPGGPGAEKQRPRRATHHPRRAPSRPIISESSQATSFVTSEEKERPAEPETRTQTPPTPQSPHRPHPGRPPQARSPAQPCPGGRGQAHPSPAPQASGRALTEADEEADPLLLLGAEVQRVPQHRPATAALEHGAVLRQRSLPPRRRRRRRRRRRPQDPRGAVGGRRLLHSDEAAAGLRVLEELPQPRAQRHLLPPRVRARRPPSPASAHLPCHWAAGGRVDPRPPTLLGSGPHRVFPSPNH